MGKRKTDPLARWHRVSEFMRLIVVSSRIANIDVPLSCILVGPPGDGKSRMLFRFDHLGHVEYVSDATYMGLLRVINRVAEGYISCVVIPDFGPIVGRKTEVASQSVATLAMLSAEGVGKILVGRRTKDFGGAQASVISAITIEELVRHYRIINQSAFLSRVFLIDFELTSDEILYMMRLYNRGKIGGVLSQFRFPRSNADGMLPKREIKIAARLSDKVMRWWQELERQRPDRTFGFRSAHGLTTLVKCSAYLHRRNRATEQDLRYVERFHPLLMQQFQIVLPDV